MRPLDNPHTHGYTFHVDQFRGNIPTSPTPDREFRSNIPLIPIPDREAWTQLTGKMPMLVDARPRYVLRALACVERDASTLSFNIAINQQVRLDAVCDAVCSEIEPHPGDMDRVIFDPETKAFWLYPV